MYETVTMTVIFSTLRSLCLYRCIAYAEGRYQGMHSLKLEGSLPFSARKRQDLLIFGLDRDR